MDKKLQQSIENLKTALKEAKNVNNPVIANASITKCFEVALEHVWIFFRRYVEDAGVEAYSPKDAIRAAASAGLIDNPEIWIQFINDRNLSIHDYLGIDDKDYLDSINKFVDECERQKSRWLEPEEKAAKKKK